MAGDTVVAKHIVVDTIDEDWYLVQVFYRLLVSPEKEELVKTYLPHSQLAVLEQHFMIASRTTGQPGLKLTGIGFNTKVDVNIWLMPNTMFVTKMTTIRQPGKPS